MRVSLFDSSAGADRRAQAGNCVERGAGMPLPRSEAVAGKVQNGRLAVIHGAAHLSAIEQPAQFARIVTDFMYGPQAARPTHREHHDQ
jgi:hypothetical protein